MTKEIIINATNEETRIAILEDGKLVELFVERPEYERMVGDIYKGRVSRVLPGMQAAFIDIGHEQNAFLHFQDFDASYLDYFVDYEDEEHVDKDHYQTERRFDVYRDLKKNQDILVQIIKEPIGTKGCRVTTGIALPGRFLVLIPGKKHIGVSRKIQNPKERRRLKEIARQIMPPNFGLIIRTVAEGKSDKIIRKDLNNLLDTWHKIERKIKRQKAPTLLYKDMGMASSVIRDLFTSDVDRVVVDSRKLMRELSAYIKDVAPHLKEKISYYKGTLPIFDYYNIEKEIEKMENSKVWLRNGAYIVIEQTEALVSIDVNSGKFIGSRDHESNSLKINMEAAREIARQARLRDLGGIIVIDFIDMNEEENRKKLYNELRKEFAKDRSITKIQEISRFGLIEMTRQRVRPPVLFNLKDQCPVCQGTGMVPTVHAVVGNIERWIQRYRATHGDRRFTIHVTPEVYRYMKKGTYNPLLKLMWKYWVKIKLVEDDTLTLGTFKVFDKDDKNPLNID
ncbi:Rne/Rng family ribonuclease [Caldithrix abyssi]|uniref:Ribonuclease G n=1 Tax=Caldithrix abyssi DSM 13497 TaxID=880073 RepID=H1XXA8_CALAY|nr:Rne/Rng family ribonuclease [Caldithrix abyssi]APF17826.1 ribonuclease G [Caldithrix abyssi DSM 13497]EHO41893.1 ribonuclease, Rne/Rng family [Caldithrix abyssi DSM 13497]